nr:putative ribonuclease H-like domain-containing protein [Tanacetum cinerariifolium]
MGLFKIAKVVMGGESQVADNQVNDRYKTSKGYHAVTPPYIRNFLPLKPDLTLADIDEYVVSKSVTSVPTIATNKAKTSESKPKSVSEPIIEDWVSYSEDENETETKKSVKQEEHNKQVKHPRKTIKVPENGNGLISVTTDRNGMIKVLPPKIVEKVVAREWERKSRTTLLMALPESHLAKFYKMADAKEMWKAIKSRFGGNDEFKKMQKYLFQTLLSQLEIHGAGVSHENANQKFLRSLPSSWSQVALIMRTKPGLDTLSFDDLYNNLRVFERDVKGTTINDDNMEEMDLKWQTSIDESDSKPNEYTSCESNSSVETTTSMSDPAENAPKVVCEPKVWTNAPIIEEYESDSDNDSVSNVQEDKEKPSFAFTDSVKHVKTSRQNVKDSGTPNHNPKIGKQGRNGHTRKGLGYASTRKACFVCGTFSHLIRDCDFHEKMAKQAELAKSMNKEKEANDAAESPWKEATYDIQNANTNSTNLLNIISTPLTAAGPSRAFNDGELLYPDDLSMPHLEDFYASPSEEIFTDSSYDDEGVVTNFNNLETTVNVNPIPATRIHTIHPKTQILKDLMSAVRTRSKVNKNSKAHALISQALEDESWVDAMQEELLQFQIQKVWILTDLPFRKKSVGTKWVYRIKKDERGVVVRNKARLVSQGHREEEGIDYDEVFAPVARIEAKSIFLAFASYMDFIVYQMDVKSAFLYGTIDEEVYVTQPYGFVDPKFPNKVYKVVKALYGLHQAPRAWYATLSTFLEQSGYRRGAIDKTLFIKQDKMDIMLVQVYVDDIIFGSTKKSWCDEFEELIKNRFQMSFMGEITFFLGLQVKQKED